MLCVYGEYVRTKTVDFKRVKKWGNLDLNQGPTGYEGGGLPHLRILTNRYTQHDKG